MLTKLEDCKKRLRIQTAATKYLEGRLDTYKEHVSKQRTMLDKYHEMIAENTRLSKEVAMLSDNFWSVIGERDAIIKRQKNVIEADSITITEQMHKIEDLQKDIKREVATVDHLDDTLTKRIVDLNRIIKCLESDITLKDKALVVAREIIGNSHRLAEQYKQDSEVLKKVVEIVDMWDTYPAGKEMHKIYALVEEYIDGDE